MWCVPHVYRPDMHRHSDKNGRIKSNMQLNTHLGNFFASKGYLGTSWDILLLSWVILGSSSGQPGIILRSFWDHFRSSCGHLGLSSRNFQLSCGHPRYPSLGCPEIILAENFFLVQPPYTTRFNILRVMAEAYEPFLFELPVRFECYMLHTYMQ